MRIRSMRQEYFIIIYFLLYIFSSFLYFLYNKKKVKQSTYKQTDKNTHTKNKFGNKFEFVQMVFSVHQQFNSSLHVNQLKKVRKSFENSITKLTFVECYVVGIVAAVVVVNGDGKGGWINGQSMSNRRIKKLTKIADDTFTT